MGLTLITPSSSPEATRFSLIQCTRLMGDLEFQPLRPIPFPASRIDSLVSWVKLGPDRSSSRIYTTITSSAPIPFGVPIVQSFQTAKQLGSTTYNSPPPLPPIQSPLESCSISNVLAVRFDGRAVHDPLLLELSPVSSSYRNALTSPVNNEVYRTGSDG